MSDPANDFGEFLDQIGRIKVRSKSDEPAREAPSLDPREAELAKRRKRRGEMVALMAAMSPIPFKGTRAQWLEAMKERVVTAAALIDSLDAYERGELDPQ